MTSRPMPDPRSAPPRRARVRTAAVLLAALAALAALGARPGPPAAEAQAPVIIRMATLVPDGSSWHLILKETADRWKQALGRTRHGAALPRRRRGRRPRRGAQDAARDAERGGAHVGGRRGDRQVGLRDGHPADVRLVRRGLRRPREDAAQARGEPRGEGLRGAQLGGRRLGPLLRPEAGGGPRRPARAQALLLGRRRRGGRGVALRGLQPGAAALDRARDGAPDGPGGGARLAAAGRGDLAVLQLREVHDGAALAAAAGRDDHQQERVGEGAGGRAAAAASRSPARRARGCRRRSATPSRRTSRR